MRVWFMKQDCSLNSAADAPWVGAHTDCVFRHEDDITNLMCITSHASTEIDVYSGCQSFNTASSIVHSCDAGPSKR